MASGEIVGLIGPNGAGKSTFFNALAGDRIPTAGASRSIGHDVTRARPEAHARLGIARTFQVPVTFEDMTVAENVLVGAFLRHPRRAAAEKVAQEDRLSTSLSLNACASNDKSFQHSKNIVLPVRTGTATSDRAPSLREVSTSTRVSDSVSSHRTISPLRKQAPENPELGSSMTPASGAMCPA